MNVFRRIVSGSMLAVTVTVLGCGTETTDPPPPSPTNTIAIVSGDGQSALAGQAPTNPLVVAVTASGAGVSGVVVNWVVTGGGGSVNPTSSTTDGAGRASTTLTLGASAGSNTVTATVSGATGSPITFTATGTAPAPTAAAVSIGDNFFDPTGATVAAGGTITWTWNGSVSHNVTFPTGTNSATQSSGTFSRTFATAGSFDYLCTIHGSAMSGTIVVQ